MAYSNKTGLPSVSDILSPHVDKRWYTDESRMRGTAVHACMASYLQGLYTPRLKPEYQKYVNAFKIWIDENIDSVLKVEVRLINDDLKYCGQLDCVLRLKDREKPCVIDWKTGKAMQRSHKIQLAAYAALEAKCEDLPIDAYDCIVVRPNGKYTGSLAVKFLDHRKDFDLFRGMLKSYKFFNDKVPRMHNMEKI